MLRTTYPVIRAFFEGFFFRKATPRKLMEVVWEPKPREMRVVGTTEAHDILLHMLHSNII